jgi:hypothetical protein
MIKQKKNKINSSRDPSEANGDMGVNCIKNKEYVKCTPYAFVKKKAQVFVSQNIYVKVNECKIL